MRQLTYEFVVPSGIYLLDTSEWASLPVERYGVRMKIRKPIARERLVNVPETMGNEGVELRYTVMHVDVEVEDGQPEPEWRVPFQLITECLNWIRVLGRQYLVGALKTGTNSVARGSIFSAPGTYTNFGAIQSPIVVSPLAKETWERIGREISNCNLPTIPDSMLCDAMVSLHEQDFSQAVILLGVTAELELNSFIADLLLLQSETTRNLYDEKKYRFAEKLRYVLETLGAESYQEHNDRFAGHLIKLYELRGQAVHRDKCTLDGVEIGFGHVARFICAVQDFLHWTKGQRNRLGLKTIEAFDSPIKAMIGE
jgi:hypothetical protein